MGHGVRADDIRTPSGYDKVQNSTSGGRGPSPCSSTSGTQITSDEVEGRALCSEFEGNKDWDGLKGS